MKLDNYAIEENTNIADWSCRAPKTQRGGAQAGTGLEAIEIAPDPPPRRDPSMNIRMPEMGGLVATAKIRKEAD